MGLNKPVSFELAKLLKEKRFDKPSYSFYVIDESEYGEIGEFITNPNDNYPTLDDNSLFDTLASAPTIAEVVMWLYEKYGVWVGVQPISVVGKFQFRTYYNNKGVMSQYWNDSMGKEFNSPTEAYEDAIKYCLEKLI